MMDLEDIVEQIDLLEPIPPVAVQMMTLTEDPNSSLAEIADLILESISFGSD